MRGCDDIGYHHIFFFILVKLPVLLANLGRQREFFSVTGQSIREGQSIPVSGSKHFVKLARIYKGQSIFEFQCFDLCKTPYTDCLSRPFAEINWIVFGSALGFDVLNVQSVSEARRKVLVKIRKYFRFRTLRNILVCKGLPTSNRVIVVPFQN